MMDIFKGAARLMAMDDAGWRRHANPWSVWTRFTVLPLIVLAVWSRVWLGGWAVVPVALALGWNWLTPRLFAAPPGFERWPSRAVLGERIFLEHRDEVAGHHVRAANVLTAASLPGVIVLAWGLWDVWWEGAVFGTFLAILPKVWFCDRVVWLHDDWVRDGRCMPGLEAT